MTWGAAAAQEHMQRALAAARRGQGRTHPNPQVGCVVVAAGQVVGVGHHARAGLPHAEVVALEQAGGRAAGADMYVTLEPCCHVGRTGPCTDAIVAAGIRRVVVAMRDPYPAVNGRGLRRLLACGLRVEVGLGAAAAARLNEPWLWAVRARRPFVAAKLAQSLDGKVAAAGGHSRWITSAASRRAGHRLRDTHDAILVGSGTVLADDPRLTCRWPGGRHPRPVVLDGRARTCPSARLMAPLPQRPRPLIFVGPQAPPARLARLRRAGAQVVVCPLRAGRLDLGAAMSLLFAAGLFSVLVEGGPTLMGSLFDAGLVNRVWAWTAPLVLGGHRALSAVGGRGARRPSDGWRLRATEHFACGPDRGLTGLVARS